MNTHTQGGGGDAPVVPNSPYGYCVHTQPAPDPLDYLIYRDDYLRQAGIDPATVDRKLSQPNSRLLGIPYNKMPGEQERRAAALALLPGIQCELMRSVTKPVGLRQLQTYLNQTEPLTTQQRAELDVLLGIGASQAENLENALYALGSHAQDEFKEGKPEYAVLNKARKREVDRSLKDFYLGNFSRIMDAARDSRLPWYCTW